MRRILCLKLPNWPLQRLRAAHRVGSAHRREVIADLPAVILLFTRDPRRGEIVVAASDAAAGAGVRPGMPLAEGAALAEHAAAGGVLVQAHDAAADVAALARLAEHCERFSPLVGWETVQGACAADFKKRSSRQTAWSLDPRAWNFLGPAGLLLDVTGIGVLFGGEEALAREVVADLARLGYEARVAIAKTVSAAWGAVRQGADFWIQGAAPGEVAALRLEALRLPAETIDLLAQLGVLDVEQLLALPRESLRSRFGELLVLRIEQLLGTAQETIAAHRQPPQFVAEQVLEYPEERPAAVTQVVCELVQRVAGELAARREGVVRLGGRMDCAPGRPVLFEVGLFRPSAEAAHLWELVRMQLEQLPLPGAVGRVRVEALLTARLENRQGILFAGEEHEEARQLALFIDRCASRLGRSAVLAPELTADPLPEKAVRYRGGGGRRSEVRGRRGRGQGTGDRGQVLSSLWRPVVVYSPPVALAAVSIAPDGPPVAFELDGREHQVVRQWGPERIEAGWWRGRIVRRDYWRVQTASGQRYWLFRQLGSGQWHLHGQFG